MISDGKCMEEFGKPVNHHQDCIVSIGLWKSNYEINGNDLPGVLGNRVGSKLSNRFGWEGLGSDAPVTAFDIGSNISGQVGPPVVS